MYKWPLLETVQYCYNSGPFKKNRMSSGGYFRQSCHVIKTRVSLINVDKFAECRVLRREGQRAQHVLPLPPSYSHKLGLQLRNFPEVSIEELYSAFVFACQEFRSRPTTNVYPM